MFEFLWGGLKTRSKKLKKIVLYFLICAVPFAIYPLEINGYKIDLRKIREICLFTFAIIICSYLQKSRWLRYFIIWCVINWWFNFFFPASSYIGLVNILSALIIYIGLYNLIKSGYIKVDILLKLICCSAIFQFIWLCMQKIGFDPVFYPVAANGASMSGHVPAPLVSWSGNPSILGIFFAMASFLFFKYFRIFKKPIIFFILICSLFIIRSTTTVLCFASGIIFYIFNTIKIEKETRTLIISLILLVVLLLSFYVCFIDKPNFDRLPIWKQVIKNGLSDRPIIGRGVNFFQYLTVVDKGGTPWKETHNDYLQMWLEYGFIGILLFLGFVVSQFVRFLKSEKTHLQICIMSCLVAFLVSGITMFPLHIAQLSFYALILFACLESSYDTPNFITQSA